MKGLPKKRPQTPLEKEVLRSCLDYLQLVRIPAWRSNSGAMTVEGKRGKRFVRFSGAEGLSDIIGIIPKLADGRTGVFLAVETKRFGKKATTKQIGFMDLIIGAGGIALVVSDVKQLEAALKAEGAV